MANQKALILKEGKIQQLNTEIDSLEGITSNAKLKFHLASLSAFDKIVEVTYFDEGLESQRINQVTLTSVDYPDTVITKSVFYTDGKIERVEYQGPVLNGVGIRKNYNYGANGIRLGFSYEVI